MSAGLRILIVDDEPAIRRFLRAGLRAEGHQLVEAETAGAALAAVAREEVDLLVLDLGLPDRDGVEVIAQLRGAGNAIPIIVLSARDAETMKVAALDAGADDYVTKPFGIEELQARIRAAERHRLQRQGETALFRSGDLAIDLVRRIVTLRGQDVKLTPKEYDLLRLLAGHAGKVLTHRMLMRDLWTGDADVQYLRIYIRTLRQKIEDEPERPTLIVTETGVGYRLQLLDPSPPAPSVKG